MNLAILFGEELIYNRLPCLVFEAKIYFFLFLFLFEEKKDILLIYLFNIFVEGVYLSCMVSMVIIFW